MEVSVKLLGGLRQGLPAGCFNEFRTTLPENTDLQTLIDRVRLTADAEFIVIINNEIVERADYTERLIRQDDKITFFPPMTGG